LLFGNIAGFQPSLIQIGTAIQEIPESHIFSLGGLGEHQLAVNSIAIAQGYGVRIGLEDNIWWDEKRTRHCTNLELVRRIHDLILIHGRELLTSETLRKIGFFNKKKLEKINLPVSSN